MSTPERIERNEAYTRDIRARGGPVKCTCRKHIGIGAGGQHVGGWTDPDCAVHKGERPPWMKLDDWMDDYHEAGIPPGPVMEGSPEALALQKVREGR